MRDKKPQSDTWLLNRLLRLEHQVAMLERYPQEKELRGKIVEMIPDVNDKRMALVLLHQYKRLIEGR